MNLNGFKEQLFYILNLMVFGRPKIIIAYVVLAVSILFLIFIFRLKKQFKKRSLPIAGKFNLVFPLKIDDLYYKRDLLYQNKRSMERQMSKKESAETASLYQKTIDIILKDIKEIEEVIPGMKDLAQGIKRYIYLSMLSFLMFLIFLIMVLMN